MTAAGDKTVSDDMLAMGRRAREAAAVLRNLPADQRSRAIAAMARELRGSADAVLAANAKDIESADRMVDRLSLDPERVEGIAAALDAIAALPDPIGSEIERWQRPNGLDIARVRVPIGVIGMIYESRPNVTADAAGIAIRSGNALILRCGSDALGTSLAIHKALQAGLESEGVPADAVQLIATTDRSAVGDLLTGLDGTVDLIIPRGGKSLVARVEKEARVPVLGHLEGLCHTFVHASADPEMAVDVVVNAKMRRTSICGATETLLVDRDAADAKLPAIADALRKAGCELRGDAEAARIAGPMTAAEESDWTAEYLESVISVAVVDGVDGAAAHIARYGSGHTDAILAEDAAAAEAFLSRVDSAIVMWNASTQYADGGEFGFGAEIGIATGRLHARGPVGPAQLTTFKYQVRGNGQVRP